MDEETHRREYVLTETGRIWLGTVGKFCVRPWNFGQVSHLHSRVLGPSYLKFKKTILI